METSSYQGAWDPDAFTGKRFIGVDFSNRCLVGADFSDSVCNDCDFSDSDLTMADFTNADLYRCKFSRSVIYAMKIENANLTRTDFHGAYTYGWLLNSSANVTYADLLNFELENKRRSVHYINDRPNYIQEICFGDEIGPTSELCAKNYQVGQLRFTFENLDAQESALQRSQIYNRLKRLYRENQNGQAAIYCQYFERYYLTRSYYKYSVLTGGRFRDQVVRTILRTGAAFIAEFLSGYGVRPLRIVRNLLILFLGFFLSTLLITGTSHASGVVYRGTEVASSAKPSSGDAQVTTITLDLGKPDSDVLKVAEYSMLSMVTPDQKEFSPYGIMIALSFGCFVLSACLLALLFSSVFVRLLSE